jgi:hypothetical protein
MRSGSGIPRCKAQRVAFPGISEEGTHRIKKPALRRARSIEESDAETGLLHRPLQVGALGPFQIGELDVGAAEIGAGQVGVAKDGALEMSIPAVRAA